MDLDYKLQVAAAKYAVLYLEAEICSIDKYIDNSPTDDCKAQLIITKKSHNMDLKKLKEWLNIQEK